MRPPAPGLHLVATPIGNLGDVSLRALAVLRGADRIYCEDTRVTARLLARYGIKAPLEPYHDHNAEAARPAILAALRRGERVALVSDAGHAAGLRPRLQAGARGDRRGPAGDRSTRRVGGADRVDPVRPAARPVSVRRLSAAAAGGAAPGAGTVGRRSTRP